MADRDQIDWVNRHVTPQPFGAEKSSLVLANPIGNNLPCTYVRCTDPIFDGVERSAQFAREQPGWRYVEMAGGHDVMVTRPAPLIRLLDEIAAAQESDVRV